MKIHIFISFVQPAVEALSDREAQIALRDELQNGNLDNFIDNDDFDGE